MHNFVSYVRLSHEYTHHESSTYLLVPLASGAPVTSMLVSYLVPSTASSRFSYTRVPSGAIFDTSTRGFSTPLDDARRCPAYSRKCSKDTKVQVLLQAV